MKSLTAAACSLFLITFGADAAAGEGWRADLPWAVLESKLSTSASLIDTGFKDFASECTPEFANFRYSGGGATPEDSWSIRSTYALINQVRSILFMFVRPLISLPSSLSSYNILLTRRIN